MELPDGLTKETTRHSPSRKYLYPQDGDEVEVRFTLTAAGRELDASGDGTRRFCIGDGSVLSLAARHLYKGEHADFTVAPSLLQAEAPGLLRAELVSCPLREDLFEDQGAVKLLLRSSDQRAPRKGDECQVSYTITADEGVLAEARAGVYKIGGGDLGQFARVLDQALLSMKLKEEAVVRCRPGYIADSGRLKGAIEIRVSLEEIFQVHDVSLGVPDGSVLRKRLKEGPQHGQKLHDTGRVALRLLSATCGGQVALKDVELSFVAGDGEVCDALEGAVLGLREGDEAMLRVLDVKACEGLVSEPEAPVMIHLLVLRVEKVPEKWDLSNAQRLERCVSRKQCAGQLFQRRPRLAARHYQEIASFLTRAEDFGELSASALELRRLALLNEAACMLQLAQFKQVKELCDEVLREEPEQLKALFRRAKALMALKEHQAALEDLRRLRDLEPKDVKAQKLLREVKEELRKQDLASSKTFSKMCAGLGALPEPTPYLEPLVTAPNLDEEYAKLARETGVPLERLKPVT